MGLESERVNEISPQFLVLSFIQILVYIQNGRLVPSQDSIFHSSQSALPGIKPAETQLE